MSQSILKDLEPQKHLRNITFLRETCEQINKDLSGFSEIKIILTSELLENTLQELISQVSKVIVHIELTNNLQSFIYKVDLRENLYLDYRLGKSSNNEFSLKIIERSAQKVYLRWFFSNRLNR